MNAIQLSILFFHLISRITVINDCNVLNFFKSIVREIKIEQAYCGYRVGQPLDFTQAVPWQVLKPQPITVS